MRGSSCIEDCTLSKQHGSILLCIDYQQRNIDVEERRERQQHQDLYPHLLSATICEGLLIMDRLHPRSRQRSSPRRSNNLASALPCLDCTIKRYIHSCGHMQAYTSLCQRARLNISYGWGRPAGCGTGMRVANLDKPERANGECTGCRRIERAEKEALAELERDFEGLWKVTGGRKSEDRNKDEDEDEGGKGLVG